VLEEISRIEDTPDHKADELFTETLLTGHPLGLPVIGRPETVGAFTPAHLRSYTQRHYRTGDIIVAAAGNLSHSAIVELATKGLAGLPEGDRAPRALSQPRAERRLAVVNKELEQAHICWGTLALAANHPDRFAMDLLNAVLGGSMASRLFREIREKRGLVYAVHSYLSRHADTGTFTIYAGTRPDNSAQVIGLITEEVSKVLESGITGDELARAKDSVEGSIVLGLENTNRRMMRLGGAEAGSLELLSIDEVMERYAAVTLQDVHRVAISTLGGPRTLAVVGPHTETEMDSLLA
jgi:predicted Zn-dependent peptidase